MAGISNPIGPIEQRAASGQGRQAEPVTCSVGMKKAASIVIAKKGQDARWPDHRVEESRHAGELSSKDVIRRQEDGVEQKHIERIHVIVGGLLEMASVLAYLAVQFVADHTRAGFLPPWRFRNVRKQDAQSV